jgi:hypothetical protein
VIDTRPKHASGAPMLLSAAGDPAWFYGLTAAVAALALLLLAVGVAMLRQVLRGR